MNSTATTDPELGGGKMLMNQQTVLIGSVPDTSPMVKNQCPQPVDLDFEGTNPVFKRQKRCLGRRIVHPVSHCQHDREAGYSGLALTHRPAIDMVGTHGHRRGASGFELKLNPPKDIVE